MPEKSLQRNCHEPSASIPSLGAHSTGPHDLAFATSTVAGLRSQSLLSLSARGAASAPACSLAPAARAGFQLGRAPSVASSSSALFLGTRLSRIAWSRLGERFQDSRVRAAGILAQMQQNGSRSSTRVIVVDRESPDESLLEPAARLLRSGEIVAFPTETVYGLGANALDPQACAKIFHAKGRPSDNPLIVHISSLDMLENLSRVPLSQLPAYFKQTVDQFWPGPLTILFPRAASVPDIVTAGLDTVAVRFPSDPVATALIRLSGVPLAAPSANISGRPSGTRAEHVLQDFESRLQCVVDGGPCKVGLESTVLDMLRNPPMILRPGGVTLEALRAGPLPNAVQYGVSPGAKRDAALEEKPTTPGMKYKHYSPNAEVLLYIGNAGAIGRRIAGEVEGLLMHQAKGGPPVGLILHSGEVAASAAWLSQRYPNLFIMDLSGPATSEAVSPASPAGLEDTAALACAHDIFHALRLLDAKGCGKILVEGISETGLGAAIMNRLYKAASTVVDCSLATT